MVTTIPSKKSKITLSDYSYQRDIENRVLMANFTVFEVQLLEEILSGSLQTSISQLAQSFEISPQEITPILDSLSKTGLFERRGEIIIIHKEMRKYYESQIVKFDDEFETGMEFLRGLLRKVPIDVLPAWYSLPRTIDDIFQSLIEKYFFTPKIFQRYLAELNFDDPVLTGMMQEVFQSPELKVRSELLRAKFSLSRQQFEENMLILEYNFVCCLRYTQVDDVWKEVVTPFHEWRQYLLFIKDAVPQTLADEHIQHKESTSFRFLNDLDRVLLALQKGSLPLSTLSTIVKHPPTLYTFFNPQTAHANYVQQIIDKLLLLKLVKIENEMATLLELSSSWLELSKEKQALQLYRYTAIKFRQAPIADSLYSDKNIREAEKSLHRVSKMGWIKFEDFFKGLLAPIGQAQEVSLKKIGKQWKYAIPKYTNEEKCFVRAAIFERLWEMGMVDIGTSDGAECFCFTPFGRKVLCQE